MNSENQCVNLYVCMCIYIYIYVQHVVCIFRYLQEHILHAGENRQYDLDMNVELSQTPICMFWSSRGAGGVHFFFETKHVETRRTHTISKKYSTDLTWLSTWVLQWYIFTDEHVTDHANNIYHCHFLAYIKMFLLHSIMPYYS